MRAADEAGLLGPLRTVLFKVGHGIVNAKGKLVRDTVPPPRVGGFKARVAGGNLELRWRKAKDPSGIRGYLVERNGKRYQLVKGTSIRIPLAKARATWSVRAVDRAKNTGPRFSSIRLG